MEAIVLGWRPSFFQQMLSKRHVQWEAFENILAFAVRRVRPNCCLWIEHEAKHVGKAGRHSCVACNAWIRMARLAVTYFQCFSVVSLVR